MLIKSQLACSPVGDRPHKTQTGSKNWKLPESHYFLCHCPSATINFNILLSVRLFLLGIYYLHISAQICHCFFVYTVCFIVTCQSVFIGVMILHLISGSHALIGLVFMMLSLRWYASKLLTLISFSKMKPKRQTCKWALQKLCAS